MAFVQPLVGLILGNTILSISGLSKQGPSYWYRWLTTNHSMLGSENKETSRRCSTFEEERKAQGFIDIQKVFSIFSLLESNWVFFLDLNFDQ